MCKETPETRDTPCHLCKYAGDVNEEGWYICAAHGFPLKEGAELFPTLCIYFKER
jgi:hypothetical protein